VETAPRARIVFAPAARRSHSLGPTMVQNRIAGPARHARAHVWSLPRILG